MSDTSRNDEVMKYCFGDDAEFVAVKHYERLQRELAEAREQLEVERLRLAACGVVATADTKETCGRAREMRSEYRSGSLVDVERRVDECIQLREQRDTLAEALQGLLKAHQPRPFGGIVDEKERLNAETNQIFETLEATHKARQALAAVKGGES